LTDQHELVSIILVTHNGSTVVEESLNSLQKLQWPALDIIIVDNASTDNTLEQVRHSLPSARTITLRLNRGYGAGCNEGARIAKGEILLFMNQDVALSSKFLNGIVSMLSVDESIGLCGGVVLSWDMKTLISIGQIFERWTGYGIDIGFGSSELGFKRKMSEVFSPNGSAFAIKRKVFESIGGFNEDLFMYFDETDLSWRARIAGYRTVCSSESSLRHKITPRRAYGARPRYYIDRNSLLSAVRNYEFSSLLIFLPTSLATRFLGMIALAILGRREHALSTARAMNDFFVRLPRLWRERRASSKIRRVSDREAMRKEVLARPNDILRAFSTSLMPYTTEEPFTP
jgi:GT2 family glycosyltransferase